MEWIARLERRPRGIYCGAIGWVAPQRRACFSVAIRTALVDRVRGQIEYAVGSGVVWDSEATAEYRECLSKAKALEDPGPPFALFETMLWRPRCGVALLEMHLARLAASADYFGFVHDERAWRSAVEAGLAALAGQQTERLRIRLELAPDGVFSFTSKPFRPDRRSWRAILASAPVASENVRLFHKTTDRKLYDAALAEAQAAGADEAILWNERGELTEGTRTNLVLELGGERLTPARECGLLAGVFRQSLLERGKVREAVLTRQDLARRQPDPAGQLAARLDSGRAGQAAGGAGGAVGAAPAVARSWRLWNSVWIEVNSDFGKFAGLPQNSASPRCPQLS